MKAHEGSRPGSGHPSRNPRIARLVGAAPDGLGLRSTNLFVCLRYTSLKLCPFLRSSCARRAYKVKYLSSLTPENKCDHGDQDIVANERSEFGNLTCRRIVRGMDYLTSWRRARSRSNQPRPHRVGSRGSAPCLLSPVQPRRTQTLRLNTQVLAPLEGSMVGLEHMGIR